MKKFLSYFLIICTIIGGISFFQSDVNAETFKSTPTISMVEKDKYPIPKLIEVHQISSNQIEVKYDMDVNIELGTKSTNYWIQDTMNTKPQSIATLGKDDKVNSNNSLTNKLVKITPNHNSNNTFTLTFNQDIAKCKEFNLIICYVTVKGAPSYKGDNGMIKFVGA